MKNVDYAPLVFTNLNERHQFCAFHGHNVYKLYNLNMKTRSKTKQDRLVLSSVYKYVGCSVYYCCRGYAYS